MTDCCLVLRPTRTVPTRVRSVVRRRRRRRQSPPPRACVLRLHGCGKERLGGLTHHLPQAAGRQDREGRSPKKKPKIFSSLFPGSGFPAFPAFLLSLFSSYTRNYHCRDRCPDCWWTVVCRSWVYFLFSIIFKTSFKLFSTKRLHVKFSQVCTSSVVIVPALTTLSVALDSFRLPGPFSSRSTVRLCFRRVSCLVWNMFVAIAEIGRSQAHCFD
jgi:hypothetical protein